MQENTYEYEFVSNLFNSSINGVVNDPSYFGIRGKKIKPGFGGYLGGGLMNAQIIRVEKIFNCMVYDKFINEFKRMLKKYQNKTTNDIMKHLFHGCNQVDPKLIYSSEDGLDIRFANAGAFGQAIYFANNSGYSHSFTHKIPNGEC